MTTVYVHAVRTTGQDRGARRRHEHATKCQQCGCDVDDTTHVAAHVVRYDCPFCCPCVGYMTLLTVCRACNSAHHATDAPEVCCHPKARIWRRKTRTSSSSVTLRRVRTLWCWRHRSVDDAAT